MKQAKYMQLKWFIALVVVIATVGVFYVATHFNDVRQALVLATSRQPEPFTELYFADSDHIPTSASPGQTVPVSFVIHNKEAADTTYSYRLYFTGDEGTALFGDKQISIPVDQSQTITQDVIIPAGQGRGSLGVQVINKGQSVHFWLEREQAQ